MKSKFFIDTLINKSVIPLMFSPNGKKNHLEELISLHISAGRVIGIKY